MQQHQTYIMSLIQTGEFIDELMLHEIQKKPPQKSQQTPQQNKQYPLLLEKVT